MINGQSGIIGDLNEIMGFGDKHGLKRISDLRPKRWKMRKYNKRVS